LKDEPLDRTMLRTRYWSGYRPVVRQTTWCLWRWWRWRVVCVYKTDILKENKVTESSFFNLQPSSVACISVLSHLDRCLSLEENVFSVFFLATRLLPNVTHRSTCWEASSCSDIFEAFYL